MTHLHRSRGLFGLAILALAGCTQVDQGIDTFPSGVCIGGPQAEACDGVDNDCDGETDEIGALSVAGVVGVACGTD